MSPADLTAVAVTSGPGLALCLQVRGERRGVGGQEGKTVHEVCRLGVCRPGLALCLQIEGERGTDACGQPRFSACSGSSGDGGSWDSGGSWGGGDSWGGGVAFVDR